MNETEFKTFSRQLVGSFPDVGGMFLNGGITTANAWFQVLKSEIIGDCMDALQTILRGDEPFPNPMSTFPAVVRRLASKAAFARVTRKEIIDLPEAKQTGSKHSMPAMLNCIRDCVAAGMSTDQALAEIEKKFPIADEDRARYACLACQDSGHVRVFHHRTVAAVWHGEAKVRKYSATILCNCKFGRRRHTDASGNVIDVTYSAIYDPNKFCLWGRGNLDDLREWVENKTALAVQTQGEMPF